jgi:hypothetical protein
LVSTRSRGNAGFAPRKKRSLTAGGPHGAKSSFPFLVRKAGANLFLYPLEAAGIVTDDEVQRFGYAAVCGQIVGGIFRSK